MAASLRDEFTPHGALVIALLLAVLLALLTLPGCARTPSGAGQNAGAGGDSGAAATAPAPLVPAAVADSVQLAAQDTETQAAAAAADAQSVAAAAAVPALLDVREAVAQAMPTATEAPPPAHSVAPAAVALIVRFEIISPAYYAAKLQGFACPGDISGPTAGIGYDLGMHTPTRIRTDWAGHPAVDVLELGAGVVGFAPCRAYRAAHAAVRTPYPLAHDVFETRMLPAYQAQAARAFRNGWDGLPPNAQGALVATVYVRGGGMLGAKRAEMRQLRDECVPAHDTQCIARAHRAMCARFEGRADAAGLCKRFRETAELAVRA